MPSRTVSARSLTSSTRSINVRDLPRRRLRVGLTGGIGAGKSAVAEVFRERGALIIDADVLAREALAPGTPGQRAVAAAWPEVVDDAGVVDRARLARIVFADPAERERLNAIVHPIVRERSDALERQAPDGTVVVHVVPLLFEGEFWKTCPITVLVVAPREARIARVAARDGLSRDEIERRMAAQIEPAEAQRRATITIDNSGDLAALRARVDAVFDRMLSLQ